ncbi:MAG TPA: phosphate ABC transporter permease PstA [Rickettsiales bacterium]|nr:phosphate ABC transporter permease PstA [Rickettsiales bacterium]
MNKQISNMAARHKAERRFKLYGQLAIALALSMLVLLLGSIVKHGYDGFFHAEIRLPVVVDATALGEKSKWRHADVSPFIKQALTSRFPEVKNPHDTRALMALLSSGAIQAVRDAILKDETILHRPVELWLPASDKVDMALKEHVTRKTPQDNRKISDMQLGWLESLQRDNAARLTFSPYFFTQGDSLEPELAGFLGSMVGSLLTLLACMMIALPVGVMAAIYLEEFAAKGWITDLIELNINNLAAVPSIVYGLLGLSLYLNIMGMPRSASLAGGFTLAFIILPTIIIATRASLRAIPDTIRDAARGLGASPLQVVLHHTFPLAIPGIMTGTILGIARAMGETAPLLMIGMVAFIVDIPHNLLDPATTMPVQVYLWSTNPQESFVQKTDAGILVLLVILALLNSLAMYVRKRFEHRW